MNFESAFLITISEYCGSNIPVKNLFETLHQTKTMLWLPSTLVRGPQIQLVFTAKLREIIFAISNKTNDYKDKCPSIKAACYPVLNSIEVDLRWQIFMNMASEAFTLLFQASTVTPGGAKCFLSSFLLHYLSTLSHQGHRSSSPQHLPPPTTTRPLRWRIIMCCYLHFAPTLHGLHLYSSPALQPLSHTGDETHPVP